MNTNRDYLAVIDCKSGNVTLKRAVNFFKSDKNVNNMFIKLVIPVVIDDSEVLEYVDLEDTENFQVILRVIKPNQEFKQYTADLLKEDSIYLIDFPTSFTDIEGSYLCEFFIETLEGTERTTTNPFTYTVKNSIVEQIGEEEEIEQDLLSGLIEKIAELEEQIASNNIDLTPYATKEEVNSALDTKVDKEEGKSLISDEEIERLANVDNYDDTEIRELIDTKSDITYVDEKVEEINTAIETKADKTYVDEELDKKADITYVEEKIGDIDFSDYAIKEEVNSALDTKADIEYVDEKIANIDINIDDIDLYDLEVQNSISMGRVSSSTIGAYSVATGFHTTAIGNASHAEGSQTNALGTMSHAEGSATTASGGSSHAEGEVTVASGNYSHAEGNGTTASGEASHSEGWYSVASGDKSHAEGDCTKAIGKGSHAEGWSTEANKDYSHSEGCFTKANGDYGSHAEGCYTEASGLSAHAEGYYTVASGNYSHAEGYKTEAIGQMSHAQGSETKAIGHYSHAEGTQCESQGERSHAEGFATIAIGHNAHSEGDNTKAIGVSSHAEGLMTIANGDYQNVQGKFNIEDTENKYAHIVGNGDYGTSIRSNAYTLDWQGNGWFAGTVTATNLPTSMSFDSNGDLVVTINGVTKKFRPI